jgi:hypothetical protein
VVARVGLGGADEQGDCRRCSGPASGAERRCRAGRAERSEAEQPGGAEQSRKENASSLHLLETSPFRGSAKHCTCEAKVDLPLKNGSPYWTQSQTFFYVPSQSLVVLYLNEI